MRAYDHILTLLRGHGIPHRILEHAPAGTVDEATAVGFDPNTMLKTVVFRGKAEPARYFLCAVRARDNVDYRKLSAATGIRRDDLVRPTPEEVERALGFEAGAVGPFALTPETTVVFDQATATLGEVHCGCGRVDRTLYVRVADLIRLAGAQVVVLAK